MPMDCYNPKKTIEFPSPPMDVRAWVLQLCQLAKLSPKETIVAEYLMKGLSAKEIAECTNNTAKTIKGHLHHIYCKFQVNGHKELVSVFFPI